MARLVTLDLFIYICNTFTTACKSQHLLSMFNRCTFHSNNMANLALHKQSLSSFSKNITYRKKLHFYSHFQVFLRRFFSGRYSTTHNSSSAVKNSLFIHSQWIVMTYTISCFNLNMTNMQCRSSRFHVGTSL